MLMIVRGVVVLALLGIVPLGLRLVGGPDVARLRRVWLGPAALASVAVWLPRGWVAAGLSGPYLALTAALALVAAVRCWAAVRDRHPVRSLPVELAVWTALATPVIGASALVAERAGRELLGFELPVLALTVAHFHLAGFTAALVAALVSRTACQGPLTVVAALCVPAGTLVVLAGFFLGDGVQLAGAAVLTGGMWATGWLGWREVRPLTGDPVTRALLAASSSVLVVTMLLALDWALGEATGLPHLPLVWMAATHGVANAVGFGLCGVLAWRRLVGQRVVAAV